MSKNIQKHVTMTPVNHNKIVSVMEEFKLSYSSALNYLLNNLELKSK